MEILRAEHLKKNYAGVTALDDVDFSVQEGEFLSILGGPPAAAKQRFCAF